MVKGLASKIEKLAFDISFQKTLEIAKSKLYGSGNCINFSYPSFLCVSLMENGVTVFFICLGPRRMLQMFLSDKKSFFRDKVLSPLWVTMKRKKGWSIL